MQTTRRVRVLVAVVALMVAAWEAIPALAQPPPRAQEEFVPVDRLPQAEQLPAAPLVIVAYAFVWVVLLGYLWSVWRRLGKVEQELADVSRRMSSPDRRG